MSAATTPKSATEAESSAIVLFGEVLVDCFPDREVQGGAPFNVAHHLLGLGRAAGLAPVLVTRIGKDERGRQMLASIQAAGLAIDGIQQDSLHPTGQVRISMDGKGHHFEIVPDQAWDYIHAEMARLVALARHPGWVYFGTLAQRAASRPALRALLRASQARTFLDINLRDPWVRKDVLRWSLGKADVVKVNEEELHRVTHMMGQGGGAAKQLGERLIHAFSLEQLLVTQGEKGAWLLKHTGEFTQAEAGATVVDPVDTVGAGDGFAAVFLLGLTQGWPARQTLERAHRFAGEICRLRGAIPESAAFYQPFVEEWRLKGAETA